MSQFIFDDEYNGPRFTYGVILRPVARFSIPEGWIIDSQKPHPKYRFGTVDYPFELEPGVAGHYDMVKVEAPDA